MADNIGLSAAALILAAGKSGGSSSGVSSVNNKTGAVTLYGTDINMSTDTSLPTVTEQISSNKQNIGDLATQMGGKQDKLTAGTNITIDANNVISATGGGSSYTAGDGIEIANNTISTDDDYIKSLPVDGAYQLISNDGTLIEGNFISRTTGGTASIASEGSASQIYWRGNSENPTAVSASATLVNATNATVDSATYIAYAVSQGDTTGQKVFNADDANYGVALNGDASATVSYVAANAGTIVNASPTSLISTGFNLYDHTNTRAYVIQGNRYQVFGTYTSVGSETIVDNYVVNSYTIPHSFVASSTGYVTVVGGNSTDTMIALVWSGYNYNHEYVAYDVDTISFTDVTGWGMPRVDGVYDEIDFEQQKYIKRIGRDVVANAGLYSRKIVDSTYVYYVLDEPVKSTITISTSYDANDFGEEIFTGTTVPVGVQILYGQNLKDKLRTDVLTISDQELTAAQFTQAMSNLQLGAAKETGHRKFVNGAPTSKNSSYCTWSGNDVLWAKSNMSTSKTYDIYWTFDGVDYSLLNVTPYSSTRFLNANTTGGVKDVYWYDNSTLASYMITSGTQAKYTSLRVEEHDTSTWVTSKIDSDLLDQSLVVDTTNNNVYSGNYNLTGQNSVVIGTGANSTTQSSYYNTSLGYAAHAAQGAVAIGNNAQASGMYSTAVGRGATSTYYYGVAIGSDAQAKGQYQIAIGNMCQNGTGIENAVSIGSNSNAWGKNSAALGRNLQTPSLGSTALGQYNKIYGEAKSAAAGVQCNVGDYVWYSSKYFVCIQAITLSSSYSSELNNTSYFKSDGSADVGYLLMIGNGTSDNARSNALTVDYSGNLVCNNIPAAPSTDGTYVLKCTISSGVATYSWQQES